MSGAPGRRTRNASHSLARQELAAARVLEERLKVQRLAGPWDAERVARCYLSSFDDGGLPASGR